ncbi:MAG TPA: hypothetical protein V6D17_02975, partial [Candidatus Obscuribacterales bacterium]
TIGECCAPVLNDVEPATLRFLYLSDIYRGQPIDCAARRKEVKTPHSGVKGFKVENTGIGTIVLCLLLISPVDYSAFAHYVSLPVA